MTAATDRSSAGAQRELQVHLMAVHAQAMAASAHALLAESRACPQCATLIAARDSAPGRLGLEGDVLAG